MALMYYYLLCTGTITGIRLDSWLQDSMRNKRYLKGTRPPLIILAFTLALHV